MRKKPSEYKQRLNSHKKRGFVRTDQTQSQIVIHVVPDRNPMYSSNNIAVSIILRSGQAKRKVKVKYS